MANSYSLKTLNVTEPCGLDWNTMQGDAARRFCGACGKHVHNLSGLSADDAARLIAEEGDSLCVRYETDAAGQVKTLDYAPPAGRSRARVAVLASLAFAATLIGSVFGFGSRRSALGGVVMGKVAPSRTPTTVPTTAPAQPADRCVVR